MRVDKPIVLALLLTGFTALGATEVVRLSRLKTPPVELTIHRDLFRQGRSVSPVPRAAPPVPEPMRRGESLAPERQERMAHKIVYEGYIRRKGRVTAIISVNGEYFVVEAGEALGENLSLRSLDEKRIVVMMEDGKSREIPFQGVDENEN